MPTTAAANLRARADAAFADAEKNGGAARWAFAASLESRANRAEDEPDLAEALERSAPTTPPEMACPMTTTTPDTVRDAILARLAHLDGRSQETIVPADADAGHAGGAVVASLHVGERGARIELAWLGHDGSADMPTAVYDALADHSDTDEIEDSIRVAFLRAGGADVEVTLDWSETSATVTVTLESAANMGPRHNGGLRLVASSDFDDVGHHDGGASGDVELSTYVDAVARDDGQLVTGYPERTGYEHAALACARRLLASLGLV
jgi:hypothetical protein